MWLKLLRRLRLAPKMSWRNHSYGMKVSSRNWSMSRGGRPTQARLTGTPGASRDSKDDITPSTYLSPRGAAELSPRTLVQERLHSATKIPEGKRSARAVAAAVSVATRCSLVLRLHYAVGDTPPDSRRRGLCFLSSILAIDLMKCAVSLDKLLMLRPCVSATSNACW
jgi:hypothetical protein